MIGTAIEFPDLVDRVRDKFGLRRRFKIKIKDEDMPEGDMITMGDQDDLEMAVQSAISAAKRQRLDVAKMEVSLVFRPGARTFWTSLPWAVTCCDFSANVHLQIWIFEV